jgi:hypothetical protein
MKDKKKKKYHTFGIALKIQYEEKFEYTKRVIRSRKSKNDIMAKRTNYDLQNIKQKLKMNKYLSRKIFELTKQIKRNKTNVDVDSGPG